MLTGTSNCSSTKDTVFLQAFELVPLPKMPFPPMEMLLFLSSKLQRYLL